ncbi:hypothetical protein NDU88_003586 [Pleurodeles waltl]|uniref:Uncharacterized protein n=1 Tax=Pleurodeles waltl TaxID=8319 RepID=A0AAV7SGC7_PLEWA|nr:hypothetical protein NDU88_003586 [Pleurodeles waltl]
MDGRPASPCRGALTPPRRPERPPALFSPLSRLNLGLRGPVLSARPGYGQQLHPSRTAARRSPHVPSSSQPEWVRPSAPPESRAYSPCLQQWGPPGSKPPSLPPSRPTVRIGRGQAGPTTRAPSFRTTLRASSGPPHHLRLESPQGPKDQAPPSAVSSDGLRSLHLYWWPRGSVLCCEENNTDAGVGYVTIILVAPASGSYNP